MYLGIATIIAPTVTKAMLKKRQLAISQPLSPYDIISSVSAEKYKYKCKYGNKYGYRYNYRTNTMSWPAKEETASV